MLCQQGYYCLQCQLVIIDSKHKHNHVRFRQSVQNIWDYPNRQLQREFQLYYLHDFFRYVDLLRNLQPLFSPCTMLMGFDTRRVNTEIFIISLSIQSMEYVKQRVIITPFTKTTVYCFPRTEAFRQITPCRTASCKPNKALNITLLSLGQADDRFWLLEINP